MLSPRMRVRQVSLNGEEQMTYRGLFPLCFWWLVGWDPQWTPDRPPWPARCSWLEVPVRCSCMQWCTLPLPARTVVNPENWKHEKTRMHSSRMRTAHSLTVCHARSPATHAPTCHTCPPPRLPCMPPATRPPPTCHTCPYLPRKPPPRTEFLTHASGNITLPQLRWGR